MTAKQRATRAGFTLIEILMVIAIIAVLASLLLVGIGRAREAARRAQAANDITQLDTAATKFKQDFGFYPPSHVTISSTGQIMRFMVPNKVSGAGTPQNEASLTVLQRMFPRWNPAADVDPMTGNLAIPLAGQPLSPNQALVYFLGGPNLNGFEVAAPKNPAGSAKKGPYYDFPQSQLVNSEFIDPWNTPYAYFAANGDNYDARASFPWAPVSASNDAAQATYDGTTASNFSSDPNRATTFTVHPYGTVGKWMNPGKCQIISAGSNRLFGPGSFFQTGGATTVLHVWDSRSPQGNATSAVYYGEGTPNSASSPPKDNDPAKADLARGADDIANFNAGTQLGVSNAP